MAVDGLSLGYEENPTQEIELEQALELLCKIVIHRVRQKMKGRGASIWVTTRDVQALAMAGDAEVKRIQTVTPLTEDERRGFSIPADSILLARMRGERAVNPKKRKAERRKFRKKHPGVASR